MQHVLNLEWTSAEHLCGSSGHRVCRATGQGKGDGRIYEKERKKVLVFVQRWFVVWHIQVLHFANVCCIIFQFISVFNYELLQSTKALYLCKTLKCQTHFKDVISSHVCLCI